MAGSLEAGVESAQMVCSEVPRKSKCPTRETVENMSP